MAFDFPNSPTVGQRVTGVGGIVYVWDGVKWASNIGSVTAQSMGDVGRNLLHNPLFNVAQRGVGPWTTSSYTLDRWSFNLSLDTSSASQVVLVDADRVAIGDEAAGYTFQNTFTGNAGAASYTLLYHAIEDVRRLANKTITLSFWAKAASGTPKLGISLDQKMGAGGSPSADNNVAGVAVTLSTTWTRYSQTFTMASLSGKTLGTNVNSHYTALNFWYSSGATQNTRAGLIGVQSGTIQLWGVQLEIGSVATPLEKPDPRYDLANCQRFFSSNAFMTAGYGAAATGVLGVVPLPQQMRAVPSVVLSGLTPVNCSGVNVNGAWVNYFVTGANATASGNTQIYGTYTASADL